MKALGYYAKAKDDNNLHQFEWGADDRLFLITPLGKVEVNPTQYDIIQVGIITADTVEVEKEYSFYSSFTDSVSCKEFNNTILNIKGLTINKNANRIGSMIGIELPNIEDKIAVTNFENAVEDWLLENE